MQQGLGLIFEHTITFMKRSKNKKRLNAVGTDIVEGHATSTSVLPFDHVRDRKLQELLCTAIERLMKAFKGHRCALDVDRSLLHSELKEVIEINDETLIDFDDDDRLLILVGERFPLKF